jgi:uncharacterized protein (UPF0212 family)
MRQRRPKTTRFAATNCPHCGEVIDSASAVDAGHKAPPGDGDVGMCINCANWVEYQRIDGELHIVMPSPSTMDELRADPEAMRFELDMKIEAAINEARKAGVQEAGKLLFKNEGGYVQCFMCKADAPEGDELAGSILLATIRNGLVRDAGPRQAWVEMIKDSVGDMLGRISGGTAMWVSEDDLGRKGRGH